MLAAVVVLAAVAQVATPGWWVELWRPTLEQGLYDHYRIAVSDQPYPILITCVRPVAHRLGSGCSDWWPEWVDPWKGEEMNWKTLAVAVAAAGMLAGQQATRKVTLTWQDAVNPPGTSYTVYRANGACSATPAYTVVATGVAQKTYEDAGVAPGRYCYTVTAVYEAMESEYAVPAVAQVRPFSPQGVSVVVQ